MSHKETRTAIITGASQGIGKAIAYELMNTGVRAILAGRSGEKLEKLQADLPDHVVTPICMTLDLADLGDIARFADTVHKSHSQLDILINCGGIYRRGSLRDAPISHLDELYKTNVRGTYALTQALLPLLIGARGDIVFINSSVVFSDASEVGQYAATKHALQGVADSLRAEVNNQGIRVLSIYPGRTATPGQHDIHNTESKEYEPDRLLQPSDIANIVVACLNLPASAEVTDLRIRPRYK